MKKIFAIFMLAVLVFNMGGYMLLFQYFIKASDRFANEQISKGYYRPDELVEIKIPVRMPYVQEQRQYENISGQIQLKGSCYNYVALKMTRDTMYVKCIPNYTKTKLVNDNVITAKEISDTPLAKKNHLPIVKKTGLDNDYNYTIALFDLTVPARSTRTQLVYVAPKVLNTYFSAPAQPPDARA
ncbi:MAG: hypothetical protein WC615_04800 [Mucilaginibacter sp.]|uniref:hypothetical protein n=1 Tax=Mucilaginibacter sp. TaxID=1882438 RepID=UPI0035675221